MSIELILKKDVEGLGEEGEIKQVRPGYARNYLLPYGYAVVKNPYNLKKLEASLEEITKRKQKRMAVSQDMLEKMSQLEIRFAVRADGEKLFGSITKNDILAQLKELGYEIKKNKILMDSSLKYLGEHKVSIQLYADQKATFKSFNF